MAVKRRATAKRTPKPPIQFGEIETPREALRWLREQVKEKKDIWHSEARRLEEKFPERFKFDERHFYESTHNAPSLVEVSNHRSWIEHFAETRNKNWWAVGDDILVRLGDDPTTSEEDAIRELENEYIFDQNDLSNLESETQHEDWNEYGRKDLRREIENNTNEADADNIEALMTTVTDEMLDDFVHEIWSEGSHYPETEGTGTNFPDVLEDWDGSLLELGEMLNLAEHGYIVEITLSRAAFYRGRIILRRQDLPEEVRSLLNNPEPIQAIYDPLLCDSPYLTCRWTGSKELEARKHESDYIDPSQLRLPGVSERRRGRK